VTGGADVTERADLLVAGAELVVTMDGRELPGGWVALSDGFVAAVGGPGDPPPAAARTLRADDGLVTPGLVNTHHHMYQNLTRAYAPSSAQGLFDWLRTLYPIWAGLDEEGAYESAWIGLVELALGGCTTSTDHLYLHPRGRGDLIGAEIRAATEIGVRFHPTRGAMSLTEKDGGLPPDEVGEDEDDALAEMERLVKAHHDPGPGAMIRVALAPTSPFSVTPALMRRAAELAEALDVRLHTHLAEVVEETEFCVERFGMRPVDYFADVGWASDRAWVAHLVHPDAAEITRLGEWGTGVAHCPSSNMLLGAGLAPVAELRAAGAPVGLGCDGSASADAGSLWLEARTALLQGKLRHGAASMSARDVLEIATVGGARCLGREGELGVLRAGAAADLVVWPLDGVPFAGAGSDPVEAWLRCGPVAARHTVIAGRPVVEDGEVRVPGLAGHLAAHARIAARLQGRA
jgi:cytosine/adenosine deaminase-related metal-dependent hydrolase